MSFVQPPLRSVSILTLGSTALGSIMASITMNVFTMNQTAGGTGPGPYQPRGRRS